MPNNSEKSVNTKLAECLRSKLWGWSVDAEQTDVFVDRQKQPDLVISHAGGLTVILETEFSPAHGVEADTRRRLGQTVNATSEQIEQCIAVKMPVSLRKVEQKHLEMAIKTARYNYVVFTFDGKDELYDHIERWPGSGWLEGGLDDLASCIETVALSERRVAKGVKILERGVSQAAGYLQFHAPEYVLDELAEELHQQGGEQTTRMAMAILANAVIFHMRLVRHHAKIKSLSHTKNELGTIIQSDVIEAWRAILKINYWPIFRLASDLFLILPERESQKVIAILNDMAAQLERFGAADIQDLSGRMFQQLITDRKFLATFYTLPASATLLSELAVSRIGVNWSSSQEVTSLQVCDLACGTGALLGATYHAFASRHRRGGKDDRRLHAKMMERVLTAADIMPSAVHLTAATLSGMHPDKPYGHTRIITMPYGEDSKENGISIGSLDLMEANETRAIFGTGRKALSGKGAAVEDSKGMVVEVPHQSMDLVVMNPPFTRPTNHEATEVPVPSFAGFQTQKQEQSKMSARLREIRKGLSYPAGHGNAGLASNFIDLAHAKLRPGGVLALVLPASFMQGKSWENARTLLRRCYEDILVVSIAAEGNTDRAFSADTAMAEVLVVATRKVENNKPDNDISIANLHQRPATQLEALVLADLIEQSRIDPSQPGGRLALTETEMAGSFFRTSDWGGFGIRELTLLKCMNALEDGELLWPRMGGSESIPVCQLGELGRRGLLSRDINGLNSDGTPRGPFEIVSMTDGTPEYPVLWGHDATREQRFVVEPDQQGMVRSGYRRQAAEKWRNEASRLHYNVDFRLNSQPLATCITEKPCLGGTAWPNFITQEEWEIPLVLWGNTTLGLIAFWWIGTRQQQGRSRLSISRMPELISMDPRQLTQKQLDQSQEIFDQFKGRDFLPANEAYRDQARIDLDQAVMVLLLGVQEEKLENLSILRQQWCEEPSVHGGKATKPV